MIACGLPCQPKTTDLPDNVGCRPSDDCLFRASGQFLQMRVGTRKGIHHVSTGTMSIALRVRCALGCARRPFSGQVDCWAFQNVLQPLPVVPPKPTFGRSTYSSLQHSKPEPGTNTVKGVDTGREDIRERVVILGSGWAGMTFHCQFKPGQVHCFLISNPTVSRLNWTR